MPSYAVTRPSWFSSSLEVKEGGRLVGELVMLKKFSYALAEARMPGRPAVRFGYEGVMVRKLFIRDASGKDVADAKYLSWWKCDVAVTIDGKEYVLKQKNWWGSSYAWFAPDGTELMRFRIGWWTVQIDSGAPLHDTEILLLFFGTYISKVQEMDAASSGA